MSHKSSLAFILTAAAGPTPRSNEPPSLSYPTRLSSGSCRRRSASVFFGREEFLRRPSPRHPHAHSSRNGQLETALRAALGRPLTEYLHCTNTTDEAARVSRVRVQSLSQQLSQQLKSLSTPLESTERKQFKSESPEAASRKSSKFCMVDGCTSRAKHARRCWKHGGSVKCKVPDCVNRAKSKGVCWSHGGGSPCSVDDCDTIAVSNGFCWAHGGGKRCRERGCSRPAYERTRNFCAQHYEETQRPGASPVSSEC